MNTIDESVMALTLLGAPASTAAAELTLEFSDVISMPGLSGLEVARRATASWRERSGAPLPIFVFVTAYDEHAIEPSNWRRSTT